MMKIRMNIIIAIMITFCFTATLFMVIPIRSANQPYNPWLDYNDDGKIGLLDFVSLTNSYGTTNTENLTRNVNVTNWSSFTFWNGLNVNITGYKSDYGSYTLSLAPNGGNGTSTKTDGYRKVTIYFYMSAAIAGLFGNYQSDFFISQQIAPGCPADIEKVDLSFNLTVPGIISGNWTFARTYDVAFYGIDVAIYNRVPLQTTVTYGYYITA